jgi:Ca2+-binding EF-hand superfamily protein
MKRLLLSAAAVIALGGAVAMVAHATTRDGDHGRQSRLMHFDLNKDGNITRAEVDQGLAADFKAADKNGNGSIDTDEFKAFHADRRAAWKAEREASGKTDERTDAEKAERRERREARRAMRGDPFKHVDWNLDGSLSQDEFGDRARAMAARVDRDGDGTITAEERERRGHWRHGDRDKEGETKPDQTEQQE